MAGAQRYRNVAGGEKPHARTPSGSRYPSVFLVLKVHSFLKAVHHAFRTGLRVWHLPQHERNCNRGQCHEHLLVALGETVLHACTAIHVPVTVRAD